MKYQIQLRNPASGSYYYMTIEAHTLEQARIIAREQWGYFVEQITPLSE
jgi:hypothetical protein